MIKIYKLQNCLNNVLGIRRKLRNIRVKDIVRRWLIVMLVIIIK